jgi:hypothetical protein
MFSNQLKTNSFFYDVDFASFQLGTVNYPYASVMRASSELLATYDIDTLTKGPLSKFMDDNTENADK